MNDLQKKEWSLLVCFDQICRELGLTYFLVCGSALGAVKYKGFIPWDDDIDVGMLRGDYDRFMREAPGLLPEGIFLQNFRSDPAYPLIFAKLRDSHTTFVESGIAHLDVNHGIYIDVFPLDGYPTSFLEQQRFELRKRMFRFKLLSALESDYSPWIRLAVMVMRLFGVHKRIGKILTEYEKMISAYPPETSPFICNHGNWQGKLEYAPREQYGAGMPVEFEGILTRIPKQYDAYLTRKYGDWRVDIPLDNQKGHHHYTAMDPNIPYTEFFKRTHE